MASDNFLDSTQFLPVCYTLTYYLDASAADAMKGGLKKSPIAQFHAG
jgi:hypothetical protein